MKLRSKKCNPCGSTKHLVTLALVIPIALVLLICGPAFASGQERGDVDTVKAPPLPKVRVTIAGKTPKSVVTSSGDSFAVSRQTIIVGLDGHQVSIRKLLVPCDAEMTYSTDQKGSHPLAQIIRIKSVDSHARWQYEGDGD